MNNTHLQTARRSLWPVALLGLVLLLVACRAESPNLVIPTPVLTAAAPTAEPPTGQQTLVPTTLPPVPPTSPATEVALPTATLPPAPTIAPPLPTNTPGAQPTTVPPTAAPTGTPVALHELITDNGYRVAFVEADDMLNVRARPNANADIVTRLPAGATGIQVIGEGQAVQGSSLWLLVETDAGDGWVNSRFLTESVPRDTFCADPAVAELLEQFTEVMAEEDGRGLLALVHPERGLRLRLSWWNEEILVRGPDMQTLFRAQKKYDWGTDEGSGEKIRGSFSEVMMPILELDLLGATEWVCDEGRFGPTAGATILPPGYEAVRFYSAHRPAPPEQELDWGTWLIGVERWEGRYYISYLVHYRWEI